MAAGLPVAGESPGRGVCVFGGAGEGRHADIDWCGERGAPVELGEVVVGSGEADLESFDFAGPAFAFGFGDAGDEVVADLGDAVALAG